MDPLAGHLAANVKQLRSARGFTQQQMARLSGLPRATWSNLESGSANPTLAVLHRVAGALQVSLEELLAPPRAASRFYPRGSLPVRARGEVLIRQLLPDPIPGSEIGRMEFAPLARLTGIPHTPGTREYLTCESGRIALVVAGEEWLLEPGDVISFRADQRHSYANPTRHTAVGYSVVLLAPMSAR
ncbi:MAG TPA: XRE family transcriptional regulator [Myxococcales bacterium]|nr:XRE family transcriptional regulator [Myxococcales bacterium]